MRKQRQLHEMQSQVAHLRGLNRQLFDQLNLVVHGRDRVIAENAYLKEELSLLRLQLNGLEEEKKSSSTSLLIRTLLEDPPCNHAQF
ncbi:hypothetical protein J5N97_008018 [Dioscorea zingiberensis]|uniref:Uncharacterized protein n=1 Tax=Dioscorea zingiberensis TaxID=325984 RepID=A0A9D5DI21_9LILI|nr:hypothetical protein J5N97_008018 [Dioscorea zingiberensis]